MYTALWSFVYALMLRDGLDFPPVLTGIAVTVLRFTMWLTGDLVLGLSAWGWVRYMTVQTIIFCAEKLIWRKLRSGLIPPMPSSFP